MVRRFNQLTAKYRSFRLPADSIWKSRTCQTFFNKFTKKGKKALARRHMYTALSSLRYTMRRPKSYIVVRRALYRLRTQFKLVQQRKGKEMEAIPTPIRRNKRDTLNIQMLAVAVARRRESTFPERVVQEFSAITLDPLRSITLRQLDAFHREVYNERANIDRMS